MLDEISVLSGPAYLWLDLAAFLFFVSFAAWTAIIEHRPQVQDDPARAAEERLAA